MYYSSSLSAYFAIAPRSSFTKRTKGREKGARRVAELKVLVDSIVAAAPGIPDPETVASWSPALSGEIDITIHADGSWTHAGVIIQREGLVRLFASLLRREDDGRYYLVTPVEKWRITVERHPLQAIDCECTGRNGSGVWQVLLNTGGRCQLGGAQALHLPGEGPGGRDHRAHADAQPYVDLPNGLTAQLSRPAWYRLVDAATVDGDRAFIVSAGETIELGSTR